MESLTFQPNKKGVISGCTIPVIFVLGYVAYAMFPDGYKILTKGELVFECVLVTVVVFGYAAALVNIIKSAGYRTMIEVTQQGFAVVDPKRSEPVFVSWSERSICVFAWKETSIAIIGSMRRYSAFPIRT